MTATWRIETNKFSMCRLNAARNIQFLLNQKQVLIKYVNICQVICCLQIYHVAIDFSYNKIFMFDSSKAHTECLTVEEYMELSQEITRQFTI